MPLVSKLQEAITPPASIITNIGKTLRAGEDLFSRSTGEGQKAKGENNLRNKKLASSPYQNILNVNDQKTYESIIELIKAIPDSENSEENSSNLVKALLAFTEKIMKNPNTEKNALNTVIDLYKKTYEAMMHKRKVSVLNQDEHKLLQVTSVILYRHQKYFIEKETNYTGEAEKTYFLDYLKTASSSKWGSHLTNSRREILARLNDELEGVKDSENPLHLNKEDFSNEENHETIAAIIHLANSATDITLSGQREDIANLSQKFNQDLNQFIQSLKNLDQNEQIKNIKLLGKTLTKLPILQSYLFSNARTEKIFDFAKQTLQSIEKEPSLFLKFLFSKTKNDNYLLLDVLKQSQKAQLGSLFNKYKESPASSTPASELERTKSIKNSPQKPAEKRVEIDWDLYDKKKILVEKGSDPKEIDNLLKGRSEALRKIRAEYGLSN